MDTKKYLSILGTIIIMGLVIALALFAWAFNKNKKNTPITSKVVLFSDEENKVNFVTKKECENYLKVEKTDISGDLAYSVALPMAKTWGGGLMNFGLMTQAEYNQISNEEFPGKPNIVLVLDNGSLVTSYGPQDWPNEEDLPAGCRVEPEKM